MGFAQAALRKRGVCCCPWSCVGCATASATKLVHSLEGDRDDLSGQRAFDNAGGDGSNEGFVEWAWSTRSAAAGCSLVTICLGGQKSTAGFSHLAHAAAARALLYWRQRHRGRQLKQLAKRELA